MAGLAIGLALSPFLPVTGGLVRPGLVCLLLVVLLAPRGAVPVAAALFILVAGTLFGLIIGNQRLDAIEAGVLKAGAGSTVTVTGFVEAEPGRSRGVVRFPFVSDRGRVMIETADRGELPVTGQGLELHGVLRQPPDWYRPAMTQRGLFLILRTTGMTATGQRRTGLTGIIDGIRGRAERGLSRGMKSREAALARGFVLGQDGGIDDRTSEDFRGSGLSHLLAVSGQNVVLLGLLAIPFLALTGIGPRARLLWIGALVLVYIPLAGGGPSIQRAGVMGLAGLLATAAGRGSSRVWALALAATVTLALNPRASADVGWQLSFAAVIGIVLLAVPLRERLAGVVGEGGWRRALSEGAAVTVAASLATAPLIAFHFERVPVATVLANLLALPAVAPAMWLGMISAALGQISSLAALPLNLLNSVLLAYIAQVATWLGRPGWAVLEIRPGGLPGLAGLTFGVIAATALTLRFWQPPEEGLTRYGLRRRRGKAALVGVAVLFLFLVFGRSLFDGDRRHLAEPPADGARVEILDVGQGDAILIRPAGRDPVLIDGGPPGGDLTGALRSADVDRLEAVILTHPDLDHFGGFFDLFGRVEVGRFLFGDRPGKLARLARNSGAEPLLVGEGQRLGLGAGLSLELLWPARPEPGTTGVPADSNERSIIALLRWRKFRMLLTGDGEAEAAPVQPGPLDVLKVAHHGSADAGLPALLAGSRPTLAVIPVGADNRYGHPTPETLNELEANGARVLRTDRDGTVSIVLDGPGYRVEMGR